MLHLLYLCKLCEIMLKTYAIAGLNYLNKSKDYLISMCACEWVVE